MGNEKASNAPGDGAADAARKPDEHLLEYERRFAALEQRLLESLTRIQHEVGAVLQKLRAPTRRRSGTVRSRRLHAALERQASRLSAQQRRVLMLLAEGKINKQIAADLGISVTTVKTHVAEVLRRLNMSRRTQAAAFAARLQSAALPHGDALPQRNKTRP